MAAMATMLLSATLALPQPGSVSAHRRANATAAGGVEARGGWARAGQAWRQWGRRRGGAVCEVAVEVGGGSRSSEEGERKAGAGTRIRVLGPLKVYHVPKRPELDIGGMEGEVKEVVTTFKGKPVSATFPYKVQLVTAGEDSKKFVVHLKEDEFEVVE